MRLYVGAVVGLVVVSALLAGCGSMPPAQDKVKPTQEGRIAAIEKLGGKNQPDLSKPEILQRILGEALLLDTLEKRGSGGEELFYAAGSQTPYTGWVKEMHRKGVVDSLGYSKDGKLEGLSTRWRENGQTALEVTYKDGKQEGLATEWHENGQKAKEATFKGGKAEGGTRWYDNGQKEEEFTYKNRKLEGPYAKWHQNGQKANEGTFKDGKQEGLLTLWHVNGQKAAEVTYKGGMHEGSYATWYNNGKREVEGTYKDGKLEGPYAKWHPNGQKAEEATFKDGVRISRSRFSYE